MNRLSDYEQSDEESSAYENAVDAITEHPGAALGFAAAAGLVVGLVAVGMFTEVRRSKTASEKMQDFFAGVKQSVEDSVHSALSG